MENLTKDRLKEIGKEEGLEGRKLADYIVFYARRFPHNLEQSECGYVREWAQRFFKGEEWNCADSESQGALLSVNPVKYRGRE